MHTTLRRLAPAALSLAACAVPCVDDGFLGMQHDPFCALVTESGSSGASSGATDAPTGTATTDATTTSSSSTTAATDLTTSTTDLTGSSSTGMNTCADGVVSGDETDVDCGGSCGGTCMEGQSCGGDPLNCASGACNGDVCVAFETCDLGPLDLLVGNTENLGNSVHARDDLNGDGIADLVIVANFRTYVAFGGPDPLDLAAVASGVGGFVINGAAQSVTGAGDFDGDGLRDILLTTPKNCGELGLAYVIFGKNDGTPVPLPPEAGQGATLQSPQAVYALNGGIAGGRDLDGDGDDDIALGSPCGGLVEQTVVIFGGQGPSTYTLEMLGIDFDGFIVKSTDQPPADLGRDLAMIPDLNGDGRAELVLGAPGDPSRVIVVFGKADNATVDIAELDAGGFVVSDPTPAAGLGIDLAAGGDVNGDGLPDILAAASGSAAYVLFGKNDLLPVDVNALGTHGFRLSGKPVALVEGDVDLDGDGLSDLVAHPPPNELSVVFGKADNAEVDLANIDVNAGFLVTVDEATLAAASLSFGDVSALGAQTLVVGLPGPNENGAVALHTPGLCSN